MAKKGPLDRRPIRVLFRYRNLIAKTLQEHQKLIDAKGHCWWGWWKRPNEDARSDIWDLLEQELKATKEVIVGLFDSGEKNDALAVRKARVTDIVRPSGESSELETSAIPAGQRDFVPEYYQKSLFSRAWLRIEEIGEPISFFREYAYEKAPHLPGIPDDYLADLVGKLVTDAAELRLMDTTIWQVRPKAVGDRDERLLTPRIRPGSPVSSNPIRVSGNRILHLTDLHFATGKNRSQHVWGYEGESGKKGTLADAVALAVKGKEVGLVVLTGDFTFVASREEFDQALKSVRRLFGELGPGNGVAHYHPRKSRHRMDQASR